MKTVRFTLPWLCAVALVVSIVCDGRPALADQASFTEAAQQYKKISSDLQTYLNTLAYKENDPTALGNWEIGMRAHEVAFRSFADSMREMVDREGVALFPGEAVACDQNRVILNGPYKSGVGYA